MDKVFWIGLLLGGLLSIPLSITANLWTDHVRDYLDRRRSIRLSKRKSKEVSTYLFVRALRDGDATSKVVFDLNAVSSLRDMLFGLVGLLCIISVLIVASNPKVLPYKTYVGWSSFTMLLFVMVFLSVSMMQYWHLLQIRRRLLWFSDYESRIREKWGDDSIEGFLAPQTNA